MTFVQQSSASAAVDNDGPMTSDGRRSGGTVTAILEAQAEQERQNKQRPSSSDRARSMLGSVGQFGAAGANVVGQACGAVWNTLAGGNASQQSSASDMQPPPWTPVGLV